MDLVLQLVYQTECVQIQTQLLYNKKEIIEHPVFKG